MPVEFNEGGVPRPDFNTQKTPKLAGWLISKGIAKDLKSANTIQVVASIVFLLISLVLFF